MKLIRPAIALSTTFACVVASPGQAQKPAAVARAAWHLTPAELAGQCRSAIARTRATINRAVTRPLAQQRFVNTLLPVEQSLAALGNGINTHAFLYNVSADAAVRDSSTACSQWLANFMTEVGADPRIYAAAQRAAKERLASAADRQLVQVYLENWRHTGASLDSATRVRTTALFQKLNDIQRDFMIALAADSTRLELTRAEADALPSQLRAGLTPKGDGFLLDVNESTTGAFMLNQPFRSARQRYATAYANRGGMPNIDRLRAAIAVRDTLAHLFGFPTWAAYQLDIKMAKTPQRVLDFLHQLDSELLPRAREEADRLLPIAAKDGITGPLESWDYAYYNERLRRSQYAVDGELVRQYFPVDHVIATVMQVYQELLGLKFTEIKPADAWAPDVRQFSVADARTGSRIGTFYLDLFPRPNKYGHFADFSLINSRRLPSGLREYPVNTVVGNWPTAAPGKAALLTHADVVVFFHEFGHAMSALCDRSPYVTIGSSYLRQDFVEALSQMLENWMWQPQVLKRVSKNASTGAPLPDSLIRKIIALKNLTSGLENSRQVFYGLFDMTMHTSGPTVDPVGTWASLQRTTMVPPPIPGTTPAAGFGHLMSGYDAGYYGYLWSKVYAQDFFTRFEKAGVMDRATGRAYRDDILAPGANEEPDVLLHRFLGRALSTDAFFREMGLKGTRQ